MGIWKIETSKTDSNLPICSKRNEAFINVACYFLLSIKDYTRNAPFICSPSKPSLKCKLLATVRDHIRARWTKQTLNLFEIIMAVQFYLSGPWYFTKWMGRPTTWSQWPMRGKHGVCKITLSLHKLKNQRCTKDINQSVGRIHISLIKHHNCRNWNCSYTTSITAVDTSRFSYITKHYTTIH